MKEEAEMGLEHSPTPVPEQQAPHFLQDVVFHGKFKVNSYEIKTEQAETYSKGVKEDS